MPEDYYDTFTQKALALTPDTANEIAKKYILPDHLIWVVVGDMSKVEAGIRDLNLGEVHKIDADGNPVQIGVRFPPKTTGSAISLTR